jgi:hypothetical protein
MKPGITRWKIRASKNLSSTYLRKFSVLFGAFSASSATVISPSDVSMTTTGCLSSPWALVVPAPGPRQKPRPRATVRIVRMRLIVRPTVMVWKSSVVEGFTSFG